MSEGQAELSWEARNCQSPQRQEKAALRRKKAAQKRAEKAQGIAERAAERERVKTLKNAEKVSQLPKQAKSKVSQESQSKVTKNCGGGAARRRRVAHKAPSPPPPTKASTGRTTRLPRKLW